MINEQVENYLTTVFIMKKGNFGFDIAKSILETKTFFPNLDFENTVYLWMNILKQKENKIKCHQATISRLEELEQKGFKVDIPNIGIRLKEHSPYSKNDNYKIFFNLEQTTLPKNLSREKEIRQFRITKSFKDKIFQNTEKNLNLKIEQSNSAQLSIDYKNRTIFCQKNNPNEQINVRSLFQALITYNMFNSNEEYQQQIQTEENKKKLKTEIHLITETIRPILNLPQYQLSKEKQKQREQDIKEYKFGNNYEERVEKLKKLFKITENILNSTNLEATFYEELKKQQAKAVNYYTQNKHPEFYTQNNFRQEMDAERERVKQEIKLTIPLENLAEEYNAVHKKGNGLVTLCPAHSDTRPSLDIDPHKNLCHCKSCGFGGDIFNFVKVAKDMNFKEALNYLTEKYNIQTRYDEIKQKYRKQNRNKTPQQLYLEQNPQLDLQTIEEIKKMPINEFQKFKIKKQEEMVKEKNYEEKPPPKERKKTKAELNSKVIFTDDLKNHQNCIYYLSEERGLIKYPKELKYIEGIYQGTNDNGEKYTQKYSGIGIINISGGADIRFPKTMEQGKAKSRSVGEKDIIILNQENLNYKDTNTFIVAESTYDMIALYNQSEFAKIYANSVPIISNGAANAKAVIDFINANKDDNSRIIYLPQADEPNQKFLQSVVIGINIQKYVRIEFSDKETEEKADINDLHKNSVKLIDRLYGTIAKEIKQEALTTQQTTNELQLN